MDVPTPDVSRRRMILTMTAAAALGATGCDRSAPPSTTSSDSVPTSVEDPLHCGPVDQPVVGFADVTDPAFAGGADPSGRRDSSEAFRAAVSSGRPVYVPPGGYLYVGQGIDHRNPFVVGAGQGATTIALGPDTTFIDSNQLWWSLTLKNIRFNGGTGHVRNRFEGVNTTDYQTVRDCAFIDYSGASISTNSVDNPYWKIERNIFRASNFRTSMGVALAGLTDGTSITNNSFQANRVHVKLGRGGNNTYITDCDFLRYGAPDGNPRIDVWFTLSPDDVNSGAGMVLTRCKFGNEHLDAMDLKILYADESDGTSNDRRWPRLDVVSPNWVGGHTVSSVFTNGIGDDVSIPLLRSTTSNIVGSTYGPVTLSGSGGAPILSTITPLRDGGRSNYVGPLLRANAYTGPLPELVVSDRPR